MRDTRARDARTGRRYASGWSEVAEYQSRTPAIFQLAAGLERPALDQAAALHARTSLHEHHDCPDPSFRDAPVETGTPVRSDTPL